MSYKAKNRIFIVILIAVGAYSTYYFLSLTPQAQAHRVEREYATVIKQLNQSPPGIPRAEEFIRRINAISDEPAPLEIQQDLREYAKTLEHALQTIQNGGDAAAYDQKTADEKTKLIADFKRYD